MPLLQYKSIMPPILLQQIGLISYSLKHICEAQITDLIFECQVKRSVLILADNNSQVRKNNMDSNPKVILSDGRSMPLIALGTMNFKPNDKSFNLNDHILNAARAGYTHFNINPSPAVQQQALGEALRLVFQNKKQAEDQEGEKIPDQFIQAFPRESIFISYKIYCSTSVEKDIRAALENMKLEYFDLVMLNCSYPPPPPPKQVQEGDPVENEEQVEIKYPSVMDVWKLLEECKDKGLVRSLGVANWTQQILLNMFPYVKYPPVVNEFECHPYCIQNWLNVSLKKLKMVLVAYCPLMRGGSAQKQPLGDKVDFMNQPILKELSTKYAKTIPQIVLNWQICRGVVVLPKTEKLDHLNDNFNITDFELLEEDVKKLESLDKNGKLKVYQLKNTTVWRGEDPLC